MPSGANSAPNASLMPSTANLGRGRARLAVRQQVGSDNHQDTHSAGRQVAGKVVSTPMECPLLEGAGLGRILTQRNREFSACRHRRRNNDGIQTIHG